MSIVEIIDSYNNKRLIRIDFWQDYKIGVEQTHTCGYMTTSKILASDMELSLEQYYQWIFDIKGNKDGRQKT